MFVGILMLALLVTQTSAGRKAIDFDQSEIRVDKEAAQVGDQLSYDVSIRNDGKLTATNVYITSTRVSVLEYVPTTLTITVSDGVTETEQLMSSDQIVWIGDIPAGGEVAIEFDTLISDSPELDTHIMGMVSIGHGDSVINRIVATELIIEHNLYLPFLTSPIEPPELTGISRPSPHGDEFEWQVDWVTANDQTNYELQEATDPRFTQNVSYYLTSQSGQNISHPASIDNQFYYRVRVVDGVGSGWSNVMSVVSAYRDEFEDSASGWEIRRQDADDTQNELSYEDGRLKLWVRGRWDYMIASPLAPAPEPPYRISFRVKFAGPANRNSYGLVYGGDANGEECLVEDASAAPPNGNQIVTQNCLNHYYRASMLWFSGADEMKLQVKQIDFHNGKNEGRGSETLKNWDSVRLSADSANDWVEWHVEVYPDGRQKLYSGNTLIMDAVDDSYINDSYWGFMAATDAMIGSDPLLDWVLVEPLEGDRLVPEPKVTPEPVEAYP